MLPKSRFLFKKTVFIKVAAFLVIIPTIVVLTFTQKQPVADAQIAFLYASSCLGGWKDVDKVTGVPEVAGSGSDAYSEENSATLYNKNTQLYCGGFKGTIPESVDRTNVSVRFSWTTEEDRVGAPAASGESANNNEVSGESSVVSDIIDFLTPTTEPAETQTEQTSEEVPIEETNTEATVPEEVPEEAPAVEEEPAPVEEVISWWRSLIPVAFAQEEVTSPDVSGPLPEEAAGTQEPVIEPVFTRDVEVGDGVNSLASSSAATTSPESNPAASSTASSTQAQSYVSPIFNQNTDKDNAIFEVLFTLDNEQWYPLGYVSRINPDIQFELPLELFQTVEDFNKLQISLKTVERFDDVPKIYLDSIWIEVSYTDVGEDPLPPPGTIEGDIIMSAIHTEEVSVVTVFRGVRLETVSNILSVPTTTATSTATSSIASTTVAEQATSTAPQTASSSASTTALQTPQASPQALVATTSTSSPLIVFESDITPEVRTQLRATPGVEVEIWALNRLTGSWLRVADNKVVATIPRAALFDNKVFWFGIGNTSLWAFDLASQSYISKSLAPNEPITIEFGNAAGIAGRVTFNNQTGLLEGALGIDNP